MAKQPPPVEVIGFTGHRDRITRESILRWFAREYPGALWLHGGAEGFDAQVDEFRKAHGIRCEVIRPDYARYGGKAAPHIRNREIVDRCDLLVACYDSRRRTGGTFAMVEYARQQRKRLQTVIALDPRFTGAMQGDLVAPGDPWAVRRRCECGEPYACGVLPELCPHKDL